MGRLPILMVLSLILPSGRSLARDPLSPGDPAPAWSALPGVDGKMHSLDDHKDSKIVVLVFTCNSCPFSVDYEDRINELAKTYSPKGVSLVAINVNLEEEDRLPKMIERAKKKGFVFPYLHDDSQKSGREYGAKATPHVFVLGMDRKIAYVGAFDDARNAAKVKKTYVKDAVEALLVGEAPKISKTKASGCSIRYE